MNHICRISLGVLLGCMILGPASAQSLEDAAIRKTQEKDLDSARANLTRDCGNIDVKVDWDSWKAGGYSDSHNNTVARACISAVNRVAGMCQTGADKDVKAAVQKGVTAILCHGGGPAWPTEATIALKGKTLDYTASLTSKPGDVKTYLMKNLKP